MHTCTLSSNSRFNQTHAHEQKQDLGASDEVEEPGSSCNCSLPNQSEKPSLIAASASPQARSSPTSLYQVSGYQGSEGGGGVKSVVLGMPTWDNSA